MLDLNDTTDAIFEKGSNLELYFILKQKNGKPIGLDSNATFSDEVANMKNTKHSFMNEIREETQASFKTSNTIISQKPETFQLNAIPKMSPLEGIVKGEKKSEYEFSFLETGEHELFSKSFSVDFDVQESFMEADRVLSAIRKVNIIIINLMNRNWKKWMQCKLFLFITIAFQNKYFKFCLHPYLFLQNVFQCLDDFLILDKSQALY